MLGENWLIFALDPNLELDAETLVFHSGPKFLCFLVDFYKYFWFWCQTEIVSKKVYAVIWPVLKITSLKLLLLGQPGFELRTEQTLSACIFVALWSASLYGTFFKALNSFIWS